MISIRRVLTEPKTALAAGGIFAGFKVSMAASNAEIAPSRPLGRRNPAFMVETRGNRERIVQREGCEEGLEP